MTPAEHAATVREALIFARGTRDHDPAVAALDALQAQAEERRDALERTNESFLATEAERDRLAARVKELEADVEQWRELATFATDKAARAALDKEKT